MTMRVLVTGATGFIGVALCDALAGAGYSVRAALRSDRQLPFTVAERVVVGDIGSTTDWNAALHGVDAIVHAAARAHIVDDTASNSDLYVETNVRGTRCLAEAGARAGVRRLVYLSSIKVNGEATTLGRPYTPADEPRPQDAYGKSKWLAENCLSEVAASAGMEAVIVRPPLVYGPGVRANFLRLMNWVDSGWPLPLGAVSNERSVVSIWNLCDLLVRLVEHRSAPGNVWMVSDGAPVSTRELVRRIGTAMGRRVRFLPVPPALLHWGGAVVGRGAEVRRFCGSLSVDISHTRAALHWTPPVGVDEALARTVRWYRTKDVQLAP